MQQVSLDSSVLASRRAAYPVGLAGGVDLRQAAVGHEQRAVRPVHGAWTRSFPHAIAAMASQAALAGNDPEGRWANGPSIRIGKDLLDDGMVAVLSLGLHHEERAVGEHRVIPPGAKQLTLATGGRAGGRLNPAHEQPAVHPVLPAGGERGVADLGDLGIGDPLSLPWLNKYRNVPKLTGGNIPLVDEPGGPSVYGIPWVENSIMATGTGAASRVVALGDWNQLVLVDRWPSFVVSEPLVKGATNYPTGQLGWYYAWRSGLGGFDDRFAVQGAPTYLM